MLDLIHNRDNTCIWIRKRAWIKNTLDNTPLTRHWIGNKLIVADADKIDRQRLTGHNNGCLRLDFIRHGHITIGGANLYLILLYWPRVLHLHCDVE